LHDDDDVEEIAINREGYSELTPNLLPKQRCNVTRGTFLRLSLLALVVAGVLSIAAVRRASMLFESLADEYANSAGVKDSISLAALPPDALSRGCVPGAVCLCQHGAGSCKSWTFQVGDVLVFQYGPATNPELGTENFLMQSLYNGAVHSAIVTEVHGPALTDIIVTESLKGNHDAVYAGTMLEVLGMRMYHGVWINRVDTARFPNFVNRITDIANWARARVGEPFDRALMFQKAIPFPWRWAAPNWIEACPGCDGRKKALDLYNSGGPGKWFCSQFVAWTLAFPGGLNTDYGSNGACVTPPWDGHVEFLEVAPGDLIHQPFYDANGIYASCAGQYGCDIGVA
jgi:hypothetical protein